jgi:hypothetical protein
MPLDAAQPAALQCARVDIVHILGVGNEHVWWYTSVTYR